MTIDGHDYYLGPWKNGSLFERLFTPKTELALVDGCKAYVEGNTGKVSDELRAASHLADGVLVRGAVDVMPSANAATRIDRRLRRGEHVLPSPFERCFRVLAGQCVGQLHTTIAVPHGTLVSAADVRQMLLQVLDNHLGQDRQGTLLRNARQQQV